MLSSIRNSIFVKFFWGLMGVYLLNISVDTADPNPNHIPEDLTINDQESIIEMAIEKLLGFEDAIPEYDDPDHEDHNKKSNVKIDLTVHYADISSDSQSLFKTRRQKHPDFESVLTSGFYQHNTPPPKI